jgi:hypothetical protein
MRDADRSDHCQLDCALIAHALSDLVADDVAEPTALTQQVGEFQRQPVAVLVCFPPVRLCGGITLKQPFVDAARQVLIEARPDDNALTEGPQR